MRKKRVLIIEASPSLRDMLAAALAPFYKVDTADSPKQALHEIRRAGHAAFVIEISMTHSRSEGLALLSQLRENGDERPVIATSTVTDADVQARCYECGADAYLAKPYHFKVLIALLQRLLFRAAHSAAVQRRVDGILLPLEPFRFGGATVSPQGMTAVFNNGQTAHLKPKEIGLLDHLSRHEGQLVRRVDLVAHVWGPNAPVDSNSLNTYLTRLRRLYDRNGHSLAKILIKKPKSGWFIQPGL